MPSISIGRLRGRFCVYWHEKNGQRRRYQLAAATRKEAEAEAIDVYRLKTRPTRSLTIFDIWAAYRGDRSGRRIAENMEWSGIPILGSFGHMRPDQITAEDCRAYVAAQRKSGRQTGTIWTELGHLRTALNWAAKRGMINRAPYVERPPKPAPRDRYLTRLEIEQLLAAEAAPHIRLAIMLMLTTAARVGAVLDLTWDRVDLNRRQIDLRSEPTGPRKGRAVVPINSTLLAALTAAKRAAISDYVIEWAGDRVGSLKTGFRAACKNAKLDDVTPHVLRHTAAVHMAEAGVPMSEISQYLGHSNEAITAAVYARFSPMHLRRAADVLDFGKVT